MVHKIIKDPNVYVKHQSAPHFMLYV